MQDDEDDLDLNLEEIDLQAPGVAEYKCEFCGLSYYIDVNRLATLHDLPICAEFATMDILDFMQRNREIKEEKRPKA